MTSKTEAQEALRAAEAALQEAIERQNALEYEHQRDIAEILHDIKTPLTAMMGYLTMLKNEPHGALGHPEYTNYILTLDRSAKRLLATCNALMARYDNPDVDTKEEPAADVGQLLSELDDLFAAQAKERGIALHTGISGEFPKIAADPHSLYRALVNLVSNAIKFTPKGGNVNVEADVDPKDNTFIMVVRDSGIGMTKEQIDRILRGENVTTLSPYGDVGTGHGLDVVNRVVQSFGGKLEIISTENRGTRIKMRFPKRLSLDLPADEGDDEA